MESKDPVTLRQERDKYAWFEFLLYPPLLDEHLGVDNSDPTASQLIAFFLTNSSPDIPSNEQLWPVSTDNDVVQLNHQTPIDLQDPSVVVDQKKQQALKLLALRTASFLNWDLNVIEKKLPLHMQFMLLNDLQKLLAPDDFDPFACPWKSMSPDLRFAVVLKHRWTIRTVITGSFPARQNRGLSVQIPGQSDPMVTPSHKLEVIMKTVFEQCERSTASLKDILDLKLDFRMPKPESFEMMSEKVSEPKHNWERGLNLNHNEFICQVSYDVGSILFFEKKFFEAQKMFKISASLYPGLAKSIFCTLNSSRLDGYCTACSNVVDSHSSNAPNQLMSRLKLTMAKGMQEAIGILLEDNIKQELSLSFRDNLEMGLSQNSGTNPDFFSRVVLCNTLRHVLDGRTVVRSLKLFLKSKSLLEFFCKGLLAIVKKISAVQRNYLRNFLLLQMASTKELQDKCQDFNIFESLFTIDEEKNLSEVQDKCNVGVPRDLSFTNNIVTKISHVERELVSTRTADSVEMLLNQLTELMGKTSFATLNSSWELPRNVIHLIRNMPPDVNQDLVYIQLAKAAELRKAHCFEEARLMLKRVEEEAGHVSVQFDTAIRLELMHTDILQFVNEPSASENMKENVLKQVKTCISAYIDARDFIPTPDLVELSIHTLINCKEWDFFSSIPSRKGDLLDFPKLLATICRDISVGKNSSRNVNTEFWEIIAQVFLPVGGQYKRSGSGASKEMIRESHNSYYTRVNLCRLIKGIKDNFALSIILGAIVRLQNILKDDKDLDIYLEYANLWPSVLSNATHFNLQSVNQFLQDVMHHCLNVHPTYAPWLKTQGDMVYIQDQFTAALKYYLSSAMVSSENFSLPLPKSLFDDNQLKRMIQCCCRLQCHTQAAVLTQFLDDSNYTLAFKELSERVCSDSCDAYFEYIWDMTLLEFLVNLHFRRGELERQMLVMRLMGQLELNANNNEEIQREAASVRKANFLRAMAKQYM